MISTPLINNYIETKVGSINNKYRLKYHMSPRVGWMNDPNGLIYFNGEYHFYYQANPYRTKPGQMVWGHFLSPDMISFKDLGVALSLDVVGENAYSGGAIESGGKINIFYTLHTEKHPALVRFDGDVLEPDVDILLTEETNEERKRAYRPNEGKDIKEEEIYHSTSNDGMAFEKGEKVFDNETLPSNLSQTDFRDPCPVKINDTYYIFVGGKDLNENKGVIIVLKSKSLDHFEYAFHLGPYYELGDMAECPSYQKVDNKDVILVSGCNVYRRDNDFKNINCSVFIVGDIDFNKGEMKVDFIKEIDKGDCYYAPQFVRGLNRPVMIGWMEMWGKKYPTSKWHHGYVGAFSIPRELFIKDGDIYQRPIEELDKYSHELYRDYLPRQADISIVMKQGSFLKIEGDNGDIVIGNNQQGVFLDNVEANGMYPCIRRTNNAYEKCNIRILLDTSSIELFVDDGREVITSRIYIDGELKMTTSGEIEELKVKEVGE